MKLEDMILVTESRAGIEINYLSSFEDYLKSIVNAHTDNPEDLAYAVMGLLDTKDKSYCWGELYLETNITSNARFCFDEPQLRQFLLGNLNPGSNKKQESYFDEGRCSKECFIVLDAHDLKTNGHSKMGSFTYEKMEHTFHTGEIVRNLNGSDYRVLEVLSERNILFLSVLTGEINVGIDTEYFAKAPRGDDVPTDSVLYGMSWGHGIYLGNKITDIDFDGIRKEYGTPEKIETLTDYRGSLKKTFFLYKKLIENDKISAEVRHAATVSIYEAFGTAKSNIFYDSLLEGHYDSGFQKKEDKISAPGKEKSR